jgi:long-chain fatty acid transport protein
MAARASQRNDVRSRQIRIATESGGGLFMRSHAVLKLILAATALALAFSPATVFASGFQLQEQNGSGLGNAFSGQAAGVKDASAIYFNPAALTGIEGGNLVISVDPIIPAYEFSDGGSTPPSLPPLPGAPPLGIPLGGTGGNAGSLTPVPNGYFSYQVGETWWLGVGVNIPFGLTTEWESDWMGRFHGIKSSIHAINVNPTVAVKVGSLSLGAGVNWQQFDAELTQNTAYGGVSFGGAYLAGGPAAATGILLQLGGPAGLAMEGLTTLDGDSTAWGWNAGALIEVGEGAKLAVSYRSKIEHTLEGTIAFEGAPSFVEQGPLGPIGAALNATFADRPITADVSLPDTLSVALAWEGESVEVLADWTRTGWSSIPSLDVMDEAGEEVTSLNLQFEDTWRAGLGLNFRLNEAWKLRLGAAYETSPVQDRYRTPRLPDNDRIWVAGGFEFTINEKNRLDLGYCRVFIDDAPSTLVALPQDPDFTEKLLSGNLVGAYTGSVNILSLQYTLSF